MRTLMKIPAGCVRRELCLGEEEGAGASRVGAVGWRWCRVPASHGWGSLHLWQPQQRHSQGCRDAVCVCRDVFVLPPGMVTFPRLPELQERLDNALSTRWDWWGVCRAFDNPGVPFHLWRLLELRIEMRMFWGIFQEEEGQCSVFSTFSPSFIPLHKSRSEGRLGLGLMRPKIRSEAPPAMAWWDSLPHGESVPFGGWIEGCVMCAGCLGRCVQRLGGALCKVFCGACAGFLGCSWQSDACGAGCCRQLHPPRNREPGRGLCPVLCRAGVLGSAWGVTPGLGHPCSPHLPRGHPKLRQFGTAQSPVRGCAPTPWIQPGALHSQTLGHFKAALPLP